MPTSKLQEISTLKNVKIKSINNDGIDILSHLKLLKSIENDYDYYILLNCGSRGPYFNYHHHSIGYHNLHQNLIMMSL